jgi:zinc transport system permease protein
MGLCLWLKRAHNWDWIEPLHGALLAAVFSACLIGWIHLRFRQREDTVIAAIWSTGMAIGVIFISLSPGYNVELMNFLFGNILWATPRDLIWLGSLDIVVIAATLLFHNRFLAICFDEEQASLQGISVPRYYLLLLNLVAISVVILIQVVGAILVIAMLAIPAAIAAKFSQKLSGMMSFAIAIGMGCCYGGITLSYYLNWPSGATIALLAALLYIATLNGSRSSQRQL